MVEPSSRSFITLGGINIALLLSSIPIYTLGEEIITLQHNNTKLICITDNLKAPIYLEPLSVHKNNGSPNIVVEPNSKINDWSMKNSNEILVEGVTDIRWEEFEIEYINYKIFHKISSLSFSVYSPEEINFFVDDDENLDYHQIRRQNPGWVHYTIQMNNGKVFYYENYKLYKTTDDLLPSTIAVKTPQEKYFKFHDYKVMTSEKISRNSTDISINNKNDAFCLMLYTSVCPHCSLHVYTSEHYYTFTGKDHTSGQWQNERILTHNKKTMKLFRNTTTGEENGFWAVDIRECPSEIQGIYRVKTEYLDEIVNNTCKILPDDSNKKDKNENIPVVSSSLECNSTGMLGTKCDIKCEDLLGSDHKYCEEYKICEQISGRSQCHCAWGYQGELCNERKKSYTQTRTSKGQPKENRLNIIMVIGIIFAGILLG